MRKSKTLRLVAVLLIAVSLAGCPQRPSRSGLPAPFDWAQAEVQQRHQPGPWCRCDLQGQLSDQPITRQEFCRLAVAHGGSDARNRPLAQVLSRQRELQAQADHVFYRYPATSMC